MANISMGGFEWVRCRDGGCRQPVEAKVVVSNNTTAIFTGDLLEDDGSGGVVTLAAATNTPSYVCVGVKQYKGTDGIVRPGKYVPAATTYTGNASLTNPEATIVLCTPIRGQVFSVPVSAATTEAAVQTLMNNNADVTLGTAGSTTTGRSGTRIDFTTIATTYSLGFRLLEVERFGNCNTSFNDVTAADWRVLVEANASGQPASPDTTGVDHIGVGE